MNDESGQAFVTQTYFIAIARSWAGAKTNTWLLNTVLVPALFAQEEKVLLKSYEFSAT